MSRAPLGPSTVSFDQDFSVGLRHARRHPSSAILAVVAYAVGLGVVGLMLTIIFGVVRGHPKDMDFDSIQTLSWDESTKHLWKSGSQTEGIRYRDFTDLHRDQTVFDSLVAYRGATFSVIVENYPERFQGGYVTPDFFKALNQTPQIGAFFHPDDSAAGSEPKAVLSDHLWRNQFDAREKVLGTRLTINGIPTLVVGVAKPQVDFPSRNDIWVTETTDPLSVVRGQGDTYFVIASLKPEHTPASALAELNTIARRYEQQFPETNTGYVAFNLQPLSSVFLGKQIRDMFYLMFACSLLVLGIACTNVANLTLARATLRMRELAIRASLGGSRSKLVRQMIVEGFSIALLGGLLGLVAAIWISKFTWAWISSESEANPPAWMNMDVDLRVAGALALITLLASLVASIVPALKASRADINEILKDNARGASGLKIGAFSKFLAFLQLCVSCGLLVATSTMVTSARQAAVYEPPYDPEGMMVARFDLTETDAPAASRADFLSRLQERLEQNPALEGVGFTSSFDMLFNWNSRWDIQGRVKTAEDDYLTGRHEVVSDNYFQILGIPILEGRGFQATDAGQNAQQVCVVNELFARKAWPGQSPLGQQLRDVWDATNPWLTVVGVVPDTKMAGPGPRDEDELGGVYRPMSVAPQASVTVFAKSAGDPTAQAQAIRAVLRDEAPNVALYRVNTVANAVRDANFGSYFFRYMFSLFGVAALVLASIGVYGVMDFSVRQRFKEFGIRQAVGATAGVVYKHVLRLGAIQVASGLLLGLALGWGLNAVIAQALGKINVTFLDYALPVLAIAAIAAVALLSPARQVTRLNLANTLRDE